MSPAQFVGASQSSSVHTTYSDPARARPSFIAAPLPFVRLATYRTRGSALRSFNACSVARSVLWSTTMTSTSARGDVSSEATARWASAGRLHVHISTETRPPASIFEDCDGSASEDSMSPILGLWVAFGPSARSVIVAARKNRPPNWPRSHPLSSAQERRGRSERRVVRSVAVENEGVSHRDGS